MNVLAAEQKKTLQVHLLFLQMNVASSLNGVEPSRRYPTAGQMCPYQIHWLMQFISGETHETHL
jgi:hypothetical protein